MSFVHPLLLGGLAFLVVPVLLHLIMRQKPKHLLFPAMRFLLKRHRTNQRKMQLRHLLLLALRMLILAAICLALARPSLFSERLNIRGKRPLAAVLLFDTSPSMEFRVGDKTRLEESKRRGLELLQQLPPGSQVAVLDSSSGGDWSASLDEAQQRIADLAIQPNSGPITSQIRLAYDLIDRLNQQISDPEAKLLPFLYVFSDRTEGSWNTNQVDGLVRRRDRLAEPKPFSAFIDVGVDKPEDLAIVGMTSRLYSGNAVEVAVTVRALGRDFEAEVIGLVDGERTAHLAARVAAGDSETLIFRKDDLDVGMHQIEARLVSNVVPLPLRNVRFSTVEVKGKRRGLTICDDPNGADVWNAALESGEERAFAVDAMSSKEALALPPDELLKYDAISLFGVKSPPDELWQMLSNYVAAGGGLAVVPGKEVDYSRYNSELAQTLLPGKLVKAVGPGKFRWHFSSFRHPIIAPFQQWLTQPNIDFVQHPRTAYRYWEISPADAITLVYYAGKDKHPALLERRFDRQKIRGRLVMLTTALDSRPPRWNDYMESITSFYPVLAHLVMDYLAGNAAARSFNFYCGQSVVIPLPNEPRFSRYTLKGPGLEGTDALLPRTENQDALIVTRAKAPGNYTVLGGDDKLYGAFSLNVPSQEYSMAKIPADQIEALFGAGSILALDDDTKIAEAIESRWQQPLDLLPWLLMALLILLALENLLANKFYQHKDDTMEKTSAAEPKALAAAGSEK
ncbi:MAG: hypothetical protein KatS3mg105_0706 [Gemmatales bacterium]|nr:MAG: hypothetical protein KatS3mg105_0706 [Gemmatales bacterium]